MKYVNPDGMEVHIRVVENGRYVTVKFGEDGELYYLDERKYEGSNQFILDVQQWIYDLYNIEDDQLTELLDDLIEGEELITQISKKSPNFNSSAKTMNYEQEKLKDIGKPANARVLLNVEDDDLGIDGPTIIQAVLAHEFSHALDINQGNMLSSKGLPKEEQPTERRAVKFENIVRKKYNIIKRTTYGGKPIDEL